MKARVSSLKIFGTKVTGDNPLPIFRDIEADKPSRGDGTLRPEEEKLLGANTGFRVLPYRMLDKYDRKKSMIELKTAVLENDRLTAVFLPEQGGRLWSLKNKITGKEILYKNPVYQPANLGIRNAWFSGGVEWNCGQYGHVVYSNSPVFFSRITAPDGEEFLRMYEFERMKRLFVQIDFHLPDGAEAIYAHISIFNQDDREQSMYWWSNIAVQATGKLRVFSDTQDVIYLDPDSISDNVNPVRVFGRAKLPFLPTLPQKDSSYPSNATYSNEFFFQNEENVDACWSAAAYEDGRLFYEASTLPLRFRKMFCWGSHGGGRRWCEYLANKKEGNYVELQAGLAPTQLNSIYIPAHTKWSFTQAIGETFVSDRRAPYAEEYVSAQKAVKMAVRKAMPAERIQSLDQDFREKAVLKTGEILSLGTGWGALEERRGGEIPAGMCFPASTLGPEQEPWLRLLEKGWMECIDVQTAPASWMVDEHFLPLLEKSVKKPEGDHYLSRLHLGVMFYELGRREEGVEQWERSLNMERSPFTLRNLACDARRKGELQKAEELMEEAVRLEGGSVDRAFAEERMELLLISGQFEKAWDFYQSLPEAYQSQDRLSMQAGVAAIELPDPDFAFVEALFTRDIACIREGDNTLTDLYRRYKVRSLLAKTDNVMTQEEAERCVDQNCEPPYWIDFRMVTNNSMCKIDKNKVNYIK
ncbi:MAG: DUF5107 domain-containing protein [Lachnospiraceae bacterium]|jgi:tetratricopeptide (TPR) repeat protein|nr:DUF5107 domain-containing protein [Lachnospiraceae bacterium]